MFIREVALSKHHRTQLFLPEDQILLLRERARATHRTVSDLVREAVGSYLVPDVPGHVLVDPIDSLIGQIDAGPRDLSSRVDDYLYGATASNEAPAAKARASKRRRA